MSFDLRTSLHRSDKIYESMMTMFGGNFSCKQNNFLPFTVGQAKYFNFEMLISVWLISERWSQRNRKLFFAQKKSKTVPNWNLFSLLINFFYILFDRWQRTNWIQHHSRQRWWRFHDCPQWNYLHKSFIGSWDEIHVQSRGDSARQCSRHWQKTLVNGSGEIFIRKYDEIRNFHTFSFHDLFVSTIYTRIYSILGIFENRSRLYRVELSSLNLWNSTKERNIFFSPQLESKVMRELEEP